VTLERGVIDLQRDFSSLGVLLIAPAANLRGNEARCTTALIPSCCGAATKRTAATEGLLQRGRLPSDRVHRVPVNESARQFTSMMASLSDKSTCVFGLLRRWSWQDLAVAESLTLLLPLFRVAPPFTAGGSLSHLSLVRNRLRGIESDLRQADARKHYQKHATTTFHYGG